MAVCTRRKVKKSRVRLSGYCRELQLIPKAEPEPTHSSTVEAGRKVKVSDVPFPAGDFRQRSDFRNAISSAAEPRS